MPPSPVPRPAPREELPTPAPELRDTWRLRLPPPPPPLSPPLATFSPDALLAVEPPAFAAGMLRYLPNERTTLTN